MLNREKISFILSIIQYNYILNMHVLELIFEFKEYFK